MFLFKYPQTEYEMFAEVGMGKEASSARLIPLRVPSP